MRKDLQNKKHPDGFLSDMFLIINNKIWTIESIETGREIYAYPFGFEYKGYKYRCMHDSVKILISASEVSSEMFKTKEKNPEFWL